MIDSDLESSGEVLQGTEKSKEINKKTRGTWVYIGGKQKNREARTVKRLTLKPKCESSLWLAWPWKWRRVSNLLRTQCKTHERIRLLPALGGSKESEPWAEDMEKEPLAQKTLFSHQQCNSDLFHGLPNDVLKFLFALGTHLIWVLFIWSFTEFYFSILV